MIKNISLNLGMRASCKGRCTIENNCVSINIGPPINDKVSCQLSDSDHIRHPDDLKPREGFSYRGTEVGNSDSINVIFFHFFSLSVCLFLFLFLLFVCLYFCGWLRLPPCHIQTAAVPSQISLIQKIDQTTDLGVCFLLLFVVLSFMLFIINLVFQAVH